jgi:hypothetical protein
MDVRVLSDKHMIYKYNLVILRLAFEAWQKSEHRLGSIGQGFSLALDSPEIPISLRGQFTAAYAKPY